MVLGPFAQLVIAQLAPNVIIKGLEDAVVDDVNAEHCAFLSHSQQCTYNVLTVLKYGNLPTTGKSTDSVNATTYFNLGTTS